MSKKSARDEKQDKTWYNWRDLPMTMPESSHLMLLVTSLTSLLSWWRDSTAVADMSLYATVIRRKRCVHTTYTSLHNYSLGGAIFISLNKYFLVKKIFILRNSWWKRPCQWDAANHAKRWIDGRENVANFHWETVRVRLIPYMVDVINRWSMLLL